MFLFTFTVCMYAVLSDCVHLYCVNPSISLYFYTLLFRLVRAETYSAFHSGLFPASVLPGCEP